MFLGYTFDCREMISYIANTLIFLLRYVIYFGREAILHSYGLGFMWMNETNWSCRLLLESKFYLAVGVMSASI